MPAGPPDAPTFLRRAATLDPEVVQPADITGHADQTIRTTPADRPGEQVATEVLTGQRARLDDAFDLLGTLGSGGIGVVRLGLQRGLGREVAVKAVHPKAPEGPARRSLLREAWAAAQLEHPNIVPVYDVVIDAEGAPHVVMRRIAGRTWSELIAHPELVAEVYGARDVRAWHLGVLQQVCNAIHFAHSRGILHRDLKPDNVMVGAFGEVYVLDWGLAVRFDGDDDGRLPLACEATRVVGTPKYMAPEMAAVDATALGPRTDVYLLGGLLYAVLTGDGPHPGARVDDTLAAIPSWQPHLPDDVPRPLVTLVERALAKLPEDRLESAEALRLGLQAWTEQQAADAAAAGAQAQLADLELLLGQPQPDRQALYHRFGAARFGFQQALRAWPGHLQARDGLAQAITRMARYELDQGDARAAGLLLDELDAPPEALVARRAAMLAARDLDSAAMDRRLADLDTTIGQRTRIFVFGVITLSWAVLPLVVQWTGGVPQRSTALTIQGALLVAVAGLVYWARDSLSRTALNRQVGAALVLVPVVMVLASLGAWQLGLDMHTEATLNLLVFAALSAMAAITITRAALPAAVCYAAGFLLVPRAPELLYAAHALGNAVLAVCVFVAWLPEAPRELFARRRDR